MYFWTRCCFVACITIFIRVSIWNNFFERWISFSFCQRNWEISGAAFFACWNDRILGHIWYVSCKFLGGFIYCMLWLLSLHAQFRCCLIFCSAFVHCLPDFEAQLLTFACVCCLHVCLGITSSSCAIITCHILLLVVLRHSFIHYFGNSNLFCGDRQVFFWFCCSCLCLPVLTVKSVCCMNLYLLVLLCSCIFCDCERLRFW